MTAPFLSLAQIRNRLLLSVRYHQPGRDGRCRVCRVPDCKVRRHLARVDSSRAPR
ncbi:hypothetical protein [Micromonospora inyonensis]|uniref:Uncharacterized protein n=1 Tax=Micromonospora inyonensis TaxID=47866 RepID=A0A1C6SVD9_9ACTN|nr:hypothetical protein [Micromonospora inyonensis]SCL15007.1 hypothetical protein GA0074694_1012 [Micromonospora inyonensis]SCL33438.1 hypothetical protein GA0074694_6228 [Micromonospora inyonensis]SCL33525.1 hypothetical protein GA0074694_6250 [Micromonospora inyonensis]